MIIKPLTGRVIVVTRPANFGASLLQRISNAGGEAVQMPVMKITPVSAPTVAPADIIIFISVNAVIHGLPSFGGVESLQSAKSNGSEILAIGGTTEAWMEQLDVPLTYSTSFNDSADRFDSEQLLASAPLQNVSGKKIQIVRGVDGRDLLGKTLADRGATVTYIEVYERSAASYARQEPFSELAERATYFTVASGQSLKFLRELTEAENPAIWPSLKLVVPSERVLLAALNTGLKQRPILAKNATDTAMLSAIFTADRD